MGPVPEDLIVFLFFGLFVLIQIVRTQRRKKAKRTGALPPAPLDVEAEAVDPAPQPMPWTPPVVELPQPRPAARAQPAPMAAPRDRSRFSRRRLMGDRRSLQNAIVIATVLGPCLAQRPRDTEQRG